MHWVKARARVNGFIATVAEGRSLKKAALAELLDKIGIESDPAA